MLGKRLAILILTLFISAAVFAAEMAPKSPLRDGLVLTGADGKLTKAGSNEGWFFEFDSDVSNDRGQIHAGASLELLPSTALEKMTDDANNRSNADYRLWARVTRYKGRNFIFPIYFLPLSKTSEPQSLTPQKSQQQETKPTINEPNDALAIPKEIIEKLKPRKIVRTAQLRKGLELKTDCILANRTGFIRNSGHRARGTGHELSFVLDALGRNVQQISFLLLPCQALERAQRTQSAEAEPVRFKIAGILTRYKGNHFLLLERATRVYSHQNFGR